LVHSSGAGLTPKPPLFPLFVVNADGFFFFFFSCHFTSFTPTFWRYFPCPPPPRVFCHPSRERASSCPGLYGLFPNQHSGFPVHPFSADFMNWVSPPFQRPSLSCYPGPPDVFFPIFTPFFFALGCKAFPLCPKRLSPPV